MPCKGDRTAWWVDEGDVPRTWVKGEENPRAQSPRCFRWGKKANQVVLSRRERRPSAVLTKKKEAFPFLPGRKQGRSDGRVERGRKKDPQVRPAGAARRGKKEADWLILRCEKEEIGRERVVEAGAWGKKGTGPSTQIKKKEGDARLVAWRP